jgi:metallophosphoesterase superfamily enzyme
MGLAHVLWEKSIPTVDTKNGPSVMAKKFAMPYGAAATIFLGRTNDENAPWVPKKSKQEVSTVRTGFLGLFREEVVTTTMHGNHDAVTPEMVADQIDKYLATLTGFQWPF